MSFRLDATVKHHMSTYESEDPKFVQKFLNSLYVDDMLGGYENVPNAFKFYCLAKERMKEGGFNLRKWLTCNEELAGLIAEREQQSFTSPPPPPP